jgi:adenylate cyclase
MSRYLHPDLVHQISQSPERVALGGQEVEATVLFSDIYDFTTTSENLAPQELVTHLNAYFSDLTRFILDHAGMLDKYTGDGIMAVFGAPLSRPDHARMACRAALAHRQFSQNMKKQDGAPHVIPFHVGTRIGIHSGKIVAGNIGSQRRMDYTAIGDTVNLAARLESVNKIYRTNIIISEATFRQVGNEFVCRELDFLRVKGKTIPTRIYELLAYRTPGNAVSYPWVDSYQEALKLYRQGQWEKAYTQFKRFSSGNIVDPAALVMMERSQYLMKNPPKNWDGIMTLKDK